MESVSAEVEHTVAELLRRLEKLEKINRALMQRVERSMDQQANAYSLFQAAIGLETQVRSRTEELKSALERLEIANDELVSARDAAERANRFKTRFFTAAGHDLLQPLHAARLSLSAMSQEYSDNNQRRLIGQVDHALSSIDELLRTILDLSKLESGIIKPALQTVGLDRIFAALAADLGPIALARNLTLEYRKTDLAVRSDPLMLRRILQNLLANSVNYAGKGRVLLAARRRGGSVRIEVWDTGPGIDPSEQGRIFEEFQRGTASGRGNGAGFGLGLSIVQRTAEALGHRVGLCSRLGHGTCFSVSVAYAGKAEPEQPKQETPPARQAYGFAGRRAVVVDNDDTVLEAMQNLLTSWGCEVRSGHSARELETLMRTEPEYRPDFILADYHLDGGEIGIGAIESLRAGHGVGIPAIVITADHSDDVTEHAKRTGCEILKKPVRPAVLRALILHMLG